MGGLRILCVYKAILLVLMLLVIFRINTIYRRNHFSENTVGC